MIAALTGYLLLRLAPLSADHASEEAEQAREIDTDGDVAGPCAKVGLMAADNVPR